MKLLLSGQWPPLRPLPVFKFATDEGRVSIDFDKTRGEWLCRKTSPPSSTVQELRGGLTEIIKALPHCQAVVFVECFAAGQQDQELDKDASRRLRAMLEWRENYEDGARYSGLRNYLSESQQQEIDDIIRLTLTARQLQFCPKNVAYVFDALSKAGGKLATLLEIAQRNKLEQEADVPAKGVAAAPDAEPHVPVEILIPETLESFPEEPAATFLRDQAHPSSPDLIAHTAPEVSKLAAREIPDANPPSFAEQLQEKETRHAPVAAFEPHVRTRKVESPTIRLQNSPLRQHVLEISGFHVALFAFLFLFAVISLPLGLTVGRGPLGQWLRDTQKSILAGPATSPPLAEVPGETALRSSIPPAPELEKPLSVSSSAPYLADSDNFSGAAKRDDATLPQETSTESTRDSHSFTKVPSPDSNSTPAIESNPPGDPEANFARNGSTGLIARNTPPLANPKPTLSPKALGTISGASRNPAPRKVAPATRPAAHRSPPSTILVTAPAHGSKPFRVTFPQKPIAASTSFAMTSELSVLVPPQPRAAPAHRPARLEAGELVYFVWPHYQKPGDRYGAAETVKVRTTIGPLGQVLDIKLLNGSASLFPATMRAIRQWRYRPTLLNKRPVPVQQEVTIEFRPPQYLSQVRTQHPSHD